MHEIKHKFKVIQKLVRGQMTIHIVVMHIVLPINMSKYINSIDIKWEQCELITEGQLLCIYSKKIQ